MSGTAAEPLDPRYNTMDKKGRLRPDFLFSYWIYAWFLLFYFTPEHSPKGTPSDFIRQYLNPSVAFYVALAENAATLLAILVYNPQPAIIAKFLGMMFVVKMLPLYLLRNDPLRLSRDIPILIGVFMVYNAYLYWNETDLWDVYKRTFESIRQGKNYTPLFGLLNTLSGGRW
jgi:hypothetical protein